MDEQIKPVVWRCVWTVAEGECEWSQYHDAFDPLPSVWDEAPDEVHAYYDQQSIDALRAEVGRLCTMLADWHSQSTCKDGLRVQSPGHAHGKIGVWDDGNGAFAGVECAQCRLWAEAAAIDAARKGAE